MLACTSEGRGRVPMALRCRPARPSVRGLSHSLRVTALGESEGSVKLSDYSSVHEIRTACANGYGGPNRCITTMSHRGLRGGHMNWVYQVLSFFVAFGPIILGTLLWHILWNDGSDSSSDPPGGGPDWRPVPPPQPSAGDRSPRPSRRHTRTPRRSPAAH